MTGTSLPWGPWLRGAVAMGLPPAAFWSLTVREWRALVGPADPPLSRATLAALCAQFPDVPLPDSPETPDDDQSPFP
jgi:uncharacterized phage protein (TIGR02216 family)